MEKAKGLDAIRIVCAAIVVVGHLNPRHLLGLEHASRAITAPLSVLELFANGPAAVIVFFVISGFCIHFPYRDLRPPRIAAFYARRLVRILIPIAVALPIGMAQGLDYSNVSGTVLWSLVAEVIYYLIYPALLAIRRRVGWGVMLAASYGIAFAVVAIKDPRAGTYVAFGTGLNWVVGLPCWLLGCVLAERWDRPEVTSPSIAELWGWRLATLAASCACQVLRYHMPAPYRIGFPWTLDLFAVVAFFWLGREVAYYRTHTPSSTLEWAGRWSYSLYLFHPPAEALADRLGLARQPGVPRLVLTYLACFGFSYLFFLAVEKPSHRLARRLFAARKPAEATPAPPAEAVAVAGALAVGD